MDGTFMSGRTSLLCTLLLLGLQVCWAVKVTVTPKVEVIQGDPVKLPCTYETSEKSKMMVVEWLIENAGVRTRLVFRSGADSKVDDGTPYTNRVTMGVDNSLNIAAVAVSDERAFICQVNGGVIGVAEARTELQVFSAPEEPEAVGTTQLLSVTSGAPEKIGHCTAKNGHPQPRIIWYKDASPLPEVKDINEDMYMVPSVVKESSGLFTINNQLYLKVQKADKDSKFHCVVEYMMPNSAPQQKSSQTFSLNMHYPMEVMTFSIVNDGPIKEGDDVTMKCVTDGNPQPTFDFAVAGKPISGEGGLLTLKKVTRNNAGEYTCSFLDCDFSDCDEIPRTLNLAVHYLDPVVIAPAGPLTAKKGDAVELQCKTKASGEYTLVWKKDSKDLSQTGALSLASVSLADAGDYLCVGSMPSVPGLVKEATVTLVVSGAPEIDAPTNGQVEKEGDMVTLTCSAQGHPAPQFTWTPSGKESVDMKGNVMVSTVTLKATAEVMKDGVVCKVSNEHGEDTKTIQVALKTAGSNEADSGNRGNPVFATADKQQGGSSGVVIAVVICVLLLLIVVAALYFLNKKGMLPCSKKDKKEVAGGEVNNDIVVEMKSGEKGNEESELLNKSAQ
ncbi:basal cell adhesion molecule isoform X2 [Alosa sapidissima]|uniref:basal cell adhesion molecule isoform X2 n=1 Tax=Alosa sapidissima TaxID=34773 RepID=UPI001C086BB6|nr:basal cell adhesion molecule isoform X2 [Alosa sapidissima]